MLFVTTSNGAFVIDKDKVHSRKILEIVDSLEIFGIAYSTLFGRLIIASRNRPGFFSLSKKSKSVSLYTIDPKTYGGEFLVSLKDIHDVHQIEVYNNFVFLTDTGKNCVQVYDLSSKSIGHRILIGSHKKDINHINAVHATGSFLMIGLNNCGNKYAEILSIPMDRISDISAKDMDGREIGKTSTLGKMIHTHDIEPYRDTFLSCASHDGAVFRIDTGEVLINANEWVRGIAVSPDGIWVGASLKAERSERHSDKLDGHIKLYSHDDYELTNTVTLAGAGQVNDLYYLGKDKLSTSV